MIPARGRRRPRVVFVGHVRYDLPLVGASERKWQAVFDVVDAQVVAARGHVRQSDGRFALLPRCPIRALEPVWWHVTLAARVYAIARRFRPHVIVAQGPFDGISVLLATAALGQRRPRIIIEVHADWRTATRLYGGRMRRAISVPADRIAVAAIRSADGLRAVSAATARLIHEITGQPPLALYPAFIDAQAFLSNPPAPFPRQPTVIWVGALQRVKDPLTLADAWRAIAALVPDARLVMIGDGPERHVVEDLVAAYPGRVQHLSAVSSGEVAAALDGATVLAVPSRREAFGRVALEALARARPVVASRVDGLPELVQHGSTGFLVDPGSSRALAERLLQILNDRELAASMGASGRELAAKQVLTAHHYAEATSTMIHSVLENSFPVPR